MDDCRHVPLPISASNVKFGFALDVGSEVEIGVFSLRNLVASGSRPRFVHKSADVRVFQFSESTKVSKYWSDAISFVFHSCALW